MAFGANTKGSSVPPGFVDALVTYADTIGNDDDLQAEFRALFAKMQSGGKEGSATIASTINGKYFGFQVTMTVEEKFAAFAEAIRRYNGDAIVATFPDFSALQR